MSTSAKIKTTTLACHAPNARQVFVAGTFNGWGADTTPMKRGRQGKWTAKVHLPPGSHEYKFIVDGVWCCEPGCDGPHAGCTACVANEFGTMNRVIEAE
jgi:1,4-alpha-glucan branching enzyme